VKIELGGGKNKREGWINYDLSNGKDLLATHLKEIPDNSVSLYYTHHCLEHLPISSIPEILSNIYRSLIKGGCVRICCPDIKRIVEAHMQGKILQPLIEKNGKFLLSGQKPEFNSKEEAFEYSIKIMGGWNPDDFGNGNEIIKAYGHKFFWSEHLFYYVLWCVGFREIKFCNCGESQIEEWRNFDNKLIKYSFFIEANK
jgi:hypothetical protein